MPFWPQPRPRARRSARSQLQAPPPRLRSAAPAPAPAGRPASELESILVEFPGARSGPDVKGNRQSEHSRPYGLLTTAEGGSAARAQRAHAAGALFHPGTTPGSVVVDEDSRFSSVACRKLDLPMFRVLYCYSSLFVNDFKLRESTSLCCPTGQCGEQLSTCTLAAYTASAGQGPIRDRQ